ncbi:uncharacterized protein [Ptychodera flava]|uniref:uncharacterized protein n=1 Tax=Ptychodera flava TaxID=63121 RepID=UPI00396A5212
MRFLYIKKQLQPLSPIPPHLESLIASGRKTNHLTTTMLSKLLIVFLVVNAVRSAPADSVADTEGLSYSLKFVNNGEEKAETLQIDTEKGIEIFKSGEPRGSQIVKDFNTGLEAIIPGDGNSCYITPLDSSRNTAPLALRSILEDTVNETKQVEDESNEYYSVAGYPILNSVVLGDTIAEKCDGRISYWLLSSEQHGRQKRGCSHRFVCGFVYVYGRWSYECRYVLYCSW